MPLTIDELMDEHAGRGHSKESGAPTTKDLLKAAVDDITEIRTQFTALTVKLDADAGDTGGDNDYAATLALAPQQLLKKA